MLELEYWAQTGDFTLAELEEVFNFNKIHENIRKYIYICI